MGGDKMFKKILQSFLLLFLFTNAHGTEIDIDKLLQNAKDQNKSIMFYHHIPGCPYCKRMFDENFKDPALLKVIDENFIYVEIYTADKDAITFKEFKGTHKEFSTHIGAIAFPATIFMDGSGNIVHRAIGYRNIDEHYADITYISTQNYKTMDLESYIEKLEFEKE